MLNIYNFIVIALDEPSILIAVQFSIRNIYKACGHVEQRRRPPITFFVYCHLRGFGHVSPWR